MRDELHMAADFAAAAALERVVLARGGAPVLDGVDLAVPSRGVIAIMGPNGAGKSLCLRLLAGLIAPTRGRVAWGVERRPRPERNEVALVFQKPVLLRRTVAANLAHALAAYGSPRRERAERIARLLAAGDLVHLADRPARVLSGGEQQRLALVRALAMRPRLLLLDEPTASLDPRATEAIERLVRQAAAEGVAVVLVTHDPGQAGRLADEVAFLNRGRITEVTPARDFLSRPASADARAYLGGDLLV